LFRADGRTDRRNRDGETDVTKLIVAVRNFANAFNNFYIIGVLIVSTFILNTALNCGYFA